MHDFIQHQRQASPGCRSLFLSQNNRCQAPWAGCSFPAQRVVARIATGGQPLDAETRKTMEQRFGYDFSRVRVHSDPGAAASARELFARAYTVGSHIVFGQGEYAPGSREGRSLLAHELTHVVQQNTTQTAGEFRVMPESHPLEAAAKAAELLPDSPADRRDATPRRVAAAAGMLARDPDEAATTGPGRKVLDIEFNAFIPGVLGRPFKSFPHARDLANQTAFDAAVAAVTSPNSWKPEPRKTEADVETPGSARKVWFYSTDERTFGGGSHRVGFKGSIDTTDIGALRGKPAIFAHACDPSHRVRSTDTGWLTSKGEKGSVDGPHARTAPVTGVKEVIIDAGSASTVATKGSAAYAFMPILAPNIDYDVTLHFAKTPASVDVSASIEHNLFPFYELLVNRRIIWTFSSTDTGPGLTNLNSSKTGSVGPLRF